MLVPLLFQRALRFLPSICFIHVLHSIEFLLINPQFHWFILLPFHICYWAHIVIFFIWWLYFITLEFLFYFQFINIHSLLSPYYVFFKVYKQSFNSLNIFIRAALKFFYCKSNIWAHLKSVSSVFLFSWLCYTLLILYVFYILSLFLLLLKWNILDNIF